MPRHSQVLQTRAFFKTVFKKIIPLTPMAFSIMSPFAFSAVGDTYQCDTVKSVGFRETIRNIDGTEPFIFRWRKDSVALGTDNSVVLPIRRSEPASEKFYAEDKNSYITFFQGRYREAFLYDGAEEDIREYEAVLRIAKCSKI